MTEELQMLDLECKELFMKQEIEKLSEKLNEVSNPDLLSLFEPAWDAVKKYYDANRADLLRRHITFVAYVSFLCEFIGQKGIYTEKEYKERFHLFEQVFELLQAE